MRLAQLFLIGNLVAVIPAFSQEVAVGYEAMNEAFGIPIWADENLWDDSADETAKRLGWPRESETSFDSSFRLYPRESLDVLGTRPFSLVLYGADGMAAQTSMVFANKGDVDALAEIEPGLSEVQKKRAFAAAQRDFKRFIRRDETTITERLTALLGPEKIERFGQGSNTTERVRRWDWNDHAILLAAPRGEYVAVRIVPVNIADGESAGRVSRAEISAKVGERVVRRDNGDVILSDMPMVDQGPKGYCVPATWERALRYLGIPADMYVLAMAGSTDVGGGTSTRQMMLGVNDVIRRNGRRVLSESGKISIRSVKPTIDKGLPLIWSMMVVDPLNGEITERSEKRKNVTDWQEYASSLAPFRSAARQIKSREGGAHVCMIVGYNETTKEIAISDSWGPEFAERWLTEEEANAISQGECKVITW